MRMFDSNDQKTVTNLFYILIGSFTIAMLLIGAAVGFG